MILDPLLSFAQRHPESFSLRLYVDAIGQKASQLDLPKVTLGRIGREALEHAVSHRSTHANVWWKRLLRCSRRPDIAGRKILFLVCGPEPYVLDIYEGRPGVMTNNLG